jgi:Leucine-rich repeat (LRR) protein
MHSRPITMNQLPSGATSLATEVVGAVDIGKKISRVELEQTLSEWAQNAEPSEKRAQAKEKILACWDSFSLNPKADTSTKLNLSHLGLKNLPTAIGSLTHLTTLNLTNNRLTQLPEEITKLVNLSDLFLGKNALQSLSENIGQLVGLKNLSIHGNSFHSIPESIGNLSQLKSLAAFENQIQSLPSSIIRLSAECDVIVGENPIAPIIITDVNRSISLHRLQNPLLGPNILFDMANHTHTIPVKPLFDELISWKNENKLVSKTQDQRSWQSLVAELPENLASALSAQLGRLRSTAHYRLAPQDLVKRVNLALDAMLKSPKLLESCANIALEGTETCDDRIALAFIELEEAIIHHDAMHRSPPLDELVTAAKGLQRSGILKQIAHQKISEIVGFIDPTEIVLKYWVVLSTELNLPSKLNDMIFHNCARAVTDHDIEKARLDIERSATEKDLNTYLANWEPWKKALITHFPEKMELIESKTSETKQQLEKKMAALIDKIESSKRQLGEFSEKYLNLVIESNLLTHQYKHAETSVISELTREIRSAAEEVTLPPLQGKLIV